MDPETKRLQGYAALILILVVGLIGIMLIYWLLRMWKRHNDRLVRRELRTPDDMPDMWHASGERLTARMSPYPRPGAPEHPPGEAEWGDDDEDGEDEPWMDEDDGWDPESDDDEDGDEPWRSK